VPDHSLTTTAAESSIHGQGYARISNEEMFEPQNVVHQTVALGRGSVVAQGPHMVEEGFAILDPQLDRHPFQVGDSFTIADAALFHAERWVPQQDIVLPINMQRHYEGMLARPRVQKVRQLWGEA
jgi:glutathione S-transferase